MLLAAAEEGVVEASDVIFTIPVVGLQVTSAVTTMWGIMAVILFLAWLSVRRLEKVPKSRLQLLFEMAVDTGIHFFAGILGSYQKSRRFFPLLGTYFIFILISNYSGLIPGVGHIKGLRAPTSHWGITAGLAITVFFLVQFYGLRYKGKKYLAHFVSPIFIAPLILPLNILEELVKPFSLSLRLFANIFGGETVLTVMLKSVPYGLPAFTMFLELIFGFVQALVFTLLASVYIANATAEDSHH